jgi:branched-chain amino acid transport system permease protein
MLAAMTTFSMHTVFGISPFICLAICGPATFLLGLFIHTIVFRRLVSVSESLEAFEGNSLLACFGVLFILQNVALSIWGGDERGYSFLIAPVNIMGAIFATNRLIALGISVVLGFALYFFLTRTRSGKAIRAVTQDSTGARLLGIHTT